MPVHPASSYVKVFGELGFLHGEAKGLLLLGVTATPFRMDKVALGNVFDKIVFERSIPAMITANYLCPPRALEVKTGVNISNVGMSHGDFNLGALEKKIDITKRNELVADTYVKYGENRHGVVFCVTVEHACNVAQAFRDKGVTCDVVFGDMSREDRQETLARYENHEIQILTNCGVLTEGWDVPDTDIIMMARPTSSRGLYTQCIGRGLRLAPGKKDCLIIDFVDLTKKFEDICTFGELIGKELQPAEPTPELEEEHSGSSFDEYEDDFGYSTAYVREIDILKQSAFDWHTQGANYILQLVDGSSLFCVHIEGEKDAYNALYMTQGGELKKISDGVLPLGYAMGSCEDFARRLSIGGQALKDATWRTKPASEKQINILKKAGINFNPNITRGEAMSLIGSHSNISATEKQKWFITKHKLHPTPELLTLKQASLIIGKFKQRQAS